MLMNKIRIGRQAYDQIMYYVHKAKVEISGFGNVRIINGIPTVTDIYLPKQENTSVETDMDADAVAMALYEHTVAQVEGRVEGELKFWWHSHVNMDTFWSGTDTDAMKTLTEHGWFIHGVFNKLGKERLAYTSHEPFGIFMDDIDFEIDESLVSDEMKEMHSKMNELQIELDIKMGEECDELFDERVTEKVWTYATSNYYNRGGHQTNQGKFSNLTENSQNTSTTSHIGLDYENEGVKELHTFGYTGNQIAYMKLYCWIYDATDLLEYETEYPGSTPWLDIQESKSIFSLGDTVVALETSIGYGTDINPSSCSGEVIKINEVGTYPIKVLWANGFDNVYKDEELKLA